MNAHRTPAHRPTNFATTLTAGNAVPAEPTTSAQAAPVGHSGGHGGHSGGDNA